MFTAVVCSDNKNGIGMEDGRIPFKNPADIANFRDLTAGHIVIMGRRTWDSLPIKYRPLPNRMNIIISSRGLPVSGEATVFPDIKSCIIELSKKKYKAQTKFVIGGATLYDYFIGHNLVDDVYHTEVDHDFKCEIKMAPLAGEWISREVAPISKIIQDAAPTYAWKYTIKSRVNVEEERFLGALKRVYESPSIRHDRTGAGTKAIFHNELSFDLANGSFPLLTTRALPFRLIFEELMFFLRGQTDNKILEDKNVRIWTQNTTRGFLDGRGLHHLAEGDMGATYGFLFRHHGARYIDCKTDYAGQGFDQLREVIRLLKEDPYSRRIIINLWDPSSMCNMSLPPCAYNYQFYVDFVGGRKLLTCKLTQRSSDISLAGGWNIASAALLTYMLARCTGMEPARLIWSTGDTHIYLNQLDGVAAQLSREPRCFPKLYFSGPIKEITDYEFGDLILANYNPHPTIKMVMNP